MFGIAQKNTFVAFKAKKHFLKNIYMVTLFECAFTRIKDQKSALYEKLENQASGFSFSFHKIEALSNMLLVAWLSVIAFHI